MVKIKLIASGAVTIVDGETPCCDKNGDLMRIRESRVGDHILITNENQSKDELAEVLEIKSKE